MLAREITARFHDAAAADAAERTSNCAPAARARRHRHGRAGRRPLAIGTLLKQANLAPVEQRGAAPRRRRRRAIDGAVVSDRGLKTGRRHLRRAGRQTALRARDAGSVKPSRRALLAAAVLAPLALRATAAPNPVEAARIERLIQFVESRQQVRFVRNGNAYSAKEAAQFLRAKYASMGGNVATAAQFIDQIAGPSSTTGRPTRCASPTDALFPSATVLAEEPRASTATSPSQPHRRPCRSKTLFKLGRRRGGDHRQRRRGGSPIRWACSPTRWSRSSTSRRRCSRSRDGHGGQAAGRRRPPFGHPGRVLLDERIRGAC